MNIDEVINKYYNDIICGNSLDIDEETLLLFVEEFTKIEKLKEIYQQGMVNRKELGKEILSRITRMKSMMNILVRVLNQNTVKYTYPDYLSDFDKILQILLILANEKSNKYITKKFYTEQFGLVEKKHGEKESGLFKGEIIVIGEKEVLESISNNKTYYGSSFGLIATNIVKKHYSLVIITNHYYENNVIPCRYDVKAKLKQFKVAGLASNLYCYTYDDELGKAVDLLDNYVETYGGNIDNIDMEYLIDCIKGKQLVKSKEYKK